MWFAWGLIGLIVEWPSRSGPHEWPLSQEDGFRSLFFFVSLVFFPLSLIMAPSRARARRVGVGR